MDDKNEALKQALECIERLNKHGWILADFEDEVYATLASLKAALEQPDRRALQAEGTHPAPCARHCEAKAFEIEIRGLKSALKQAQPVQEPSEAALQALARRCLWIAYCWNDHNFKEAYTYARLTAQKHGVHNFDEANEWITAQPVQEPTPWRDMVVVSLVREGINKHRARELADHFATQPLPVQPEQCQPLTDEEIKDCLDAADQMYCERDGDKELFMAHAVLAARNKGAKP